jgi:dephospho-CoA kinase
VTVLGVTGCVGAGKSTVRRILEAAGWSAFDVDAQAALAVSEPHVRNALRDALGPAAKLSAGAVLARLLTSPAERAIIEAIIAPDVTTRLIAWKSALTAPGVLDSALLFEAGFDRWCEATLCVTCASAVRRERVLARSTTSAAHFDAIEASQWPEHEKARRATYALGSERPLAELDADVRALASRVIDGP